MKDGILYAHVLESFLNLSNFCKTCETLCKLGANIYVRLIRRHGSDVYLGMSPVENGGSYLMY